MTEKKKQRAKPKPASAKKIPTVPKPFNLRKALEIPFLKVCNANFSDFTKRVNYLIDKDIKEHEEKLKTNQS